MAAIRHPSLTIKIPFSNETKKQIIANEQYEKIEILSKNEIEIYSYMWGSILVHCRKCTS